MYIVILNSSQEQNLCALVQFTILHMGLRYVKCTKVIKLLQQNCSSCTHINYIEKY